MNLVGICDGKKGIVTSNYYKTNKADDSFVIIENRLQDFHLNLCFKETLFEFIGEGRLAQTTTWVDEFWNRLTIKVLKVYNKNIDFKIVKNKMVIIAVRICSCRLH